MSNEVASTFATTTDETLDAECISTGITMNNEQIARICHEVNRGYCASLGDHSQLAWEDAPAWQRESAIKGVEFILANPSAPPRPAMKVGLSRNARQAGNTARSKTRKHGRTRVSCRMTICHRNSGRRIICSRQSCGPRPTWPGLSRR